MISDEQLDALSDDPEAAFVQYEGILREAVRVRNADGARGWDIEREYVAHVLAFVDIRRLPLDLPKNPPADDGDFVLWYQNFIRAVDYYKASARLQVAARRKEGYAILAIAPNFKAQIGGHLLAIRKIVEEAELPSRKRDAIYVRISRLQQEVDRDWTRTEAAMALWLDVTSAIGEGAKKLDPAIDRLERIMKVLGRAKSENDTRSLPAPEEQKQIPAPTTPPEQPKHRTDDDIPF
jgi:hypothetical protein